VWRARSSSIPSYVHTSFVTALMDSSHFQTTRVFPSLLGHLPSARRPFLSSAVFSFFFRVLRVSSHLGAAFSAHSHDLFVFSYILAMRLFLALLLFLEFFGATKAQNVTGLPPCGVSSFSYLSPTLKESLSAEQLQTLSSRRGLSVASICG
jgi:hypothetical protein